MENASEELTEWEEVSSPFSTGSPVFPPGNHEDLPVPNPGDDHQNLEDSEPVHTPGGDGERSWWIRQHAGVLQTWIFRVFGRFRNCVSCKVGLWSFAWIAGGVAAAAFLVSFWRRRVRVWWQRRLQLDSSRKSLLDIIDEKEKKISQLVHQIAQMNEMLQARRRVPVVRVKTQMGKRVSPYTLVYK